VLVRNKELLDASKNQAHKLMNKFIGPFEILSKSNNTYTLKVEGRLNPKRHVSDLKSYHERTEKVTHMPLRTIVKGKEPDVPVMRQLRARQRVNYCALAGHMTQN
jgi:hypothetical protein